MPGNTEMPLYYQSGEEIRRGDKILYAERFPGEIEFVADPSVNDPETSWYVKEFGGGVMMSVPNHLGSVFSSSPCEDDELEFVSRAD
jgi:hypothetical protein